MDFEWNEAKRRQNIQRHALDFIDVMPFFGDPRSVVFADRRKDYGEIDGFFFVKKTAFLFKPFIPCAAKRYGSYRRAVATNAKGDVMTKPVKKEKTTKAVLAADGRAMLVQSNGSLKAAQGKTDWKRLASMTDDAIDTSDSPELDDNFWATAELQLPQPKDRITIRVDNDVLGWLKRQGAGYQTKINAILRQYMQSHTKQ